MPPGPRPDPDMPHGPAHGSPRPAPTSHVCTSVDVEDLRSARNLCMDEKPALGVTGPGKASVRPRGLGLWRPDPFNYKSPLVFPPLPLARSSNIAPLLPVGLTPGRWNTAFVETCDRAQPTPTVHHGLPPTGNWQTNAGAHSAASAGVGPLPGPGPVSGGHRPELPGPTGRHKAGATR